MHLGNREAAVASSERLKGAFVMLQRQNQYARDEHEQAWQDAYVTAPPFQQKWGVGVEVQPPRRSALFDNTPRSITTPAFRAGSKAQILISLQWSITASMSHALDQ